MTELQRDLQNQVDQLNDFMNCSAYYELSVSTRRCLMRKRIRLSKELLEVYEASLETSEDRSE